MQSLGMESHASDPVIYRFLPIVYTVNPIEIEYKYYVITVELEIVSVFVIMRIKSNIFGGRLSPTSLSPLTFAAITVLIPITIVYKQFFYLIKYIWST